MAQVIEIMLRPGSIEVRFSARSAWWRRWARAWREEREARRLALFDERLLNDIGLGPGSGHPMAARVRIYRQFESRRLALFRLGIWDR